MAGAKTDNPEGLFVSKSNRLRDRFRDWLRPAGLSSGAYYFSGAACPCCGASCPVGLSGAVVLGAIIALLLRVWCALRTSVSSILKKSSGFVTKYLSLKV